MALFDKVFITSYYQFVVMSLSCFASEILTLIWHMSLPVTLNDPTKRVKMCHIFRPIKNFK